MEELVRAALVAFGVIFVAELGDKTQLLALGFGARYSLRRVAVGLALGYGAASMIAVVVGGALGAAFPQRPIEIIGGIVFIAFAILAVRRDEDGSDGDRGGDEDHIRDKGGGAPKSIVTSIAKSSIVVSIGLTILVAEMGDKTQIATATLAARSNPVGTWIGATLGEVASGLVGAVAGNFIGDRISPTRLRWISALLFAAFGILMIVGWT
jgi:Ca2+/H+ antiporter, TMEM165/GDT1 family